jgi:protein required for attachment to host cells
MASNDNLDPMEALRNFAREYRQVREQHERESPQGATRRRLKQDMDRIAHSYERLLGQWVTDDDLRQAWRDHLYRGGVVPNRPQLAVPPLFRGRTDSGARVEIMAAPDGGYDLLNDGSLAEHHEIPWHLDPERIDPVQIGAWTCEEVFSAPEEAVAALDEFLTQPTASPPWRWAQVLYEDGLVDADFGLTPRGARRLRAGQEPAPQPSQEQTNVCVVLANSARGRILTLVGAGSGIDAPAARLLDAADVNNPAARARDSERFSDSRPGLRREGNHGPRHGVSDRRDRNRDDADRQFAQQVVAEAARIWSQFPAARIIVSAGPQMLGVLRPVLEKLPNSTPNKVIEFPRDLTQLPAAAVHDALARAGYLPARERRPPLTPMRTPNPWQQGT